MNRLVLDTGPLIALFSVHDTFHEQCKVGFMQLPTLFGEVLTPLPILFEVYKFVLRQQSSAVAQNALTVIAENTVIVSVEMKMWRDIYCLVCQLPQWKGSLEDASVIIAARQHEAQIWTLDYRDFSWFRQLDLWSP